MDAGEVDAVKCRVVLKVRFRNVAAAVALRARYELNRSHVRAGKGLKRPLAAILDEGTQVDDSNSEHNGSNPPLLRSPTHQQQNPCSATTRLRLSRRGISQAEDRGGIPSAITQKCRFQPTRIRVDPLVICLAMTLQLSCYAPTHDQAAPARPALPFVRFARGSLKSFHGLFRVKAAKRRA